MTDRMKILVIAARLCYPLDGGAKIRAYHLLRALAERHNVTMLAYYGNTTEEKYFPHFKDIGVTLVPIYSPAIDAAITITSIWRALLSGLPLNVAKYYSREMADAIAEQLDDEVDCIHCEHLHMFSMIQQADWPVILDAHNVESQIAERYAAAESNLLKKALLIWNGSRMRRYEVVAVRLSKLVLAVSEEDKKTFSSMSSVHNVKVVENGVDIDYFAPQSVKGSKSLVFVGSMDWLPNSEGVFWFLDKVWALIKRQAPDVSCVVVGKNPSAALLNRGRSLPGVTITGAVDDVRPYVARAALSIVPLRIGGGTRLKILEAFAMGKTVVSTTLGAEGIEYSDGQNIVIADTAEEFASTVLMLMENESKRHGIGVEARQLAEHKYSWSALGEKLVKYYEEVDLTGND
jgi:polysaccharide biosynthesis protein PslH